MTYTVEEYTHKGCNIEIAQDDDPGNPRIEWDNQFTMVCFHSRYTGLGDENGKSQAQDDVRNSPLYNAWWEDYDNVDMLDLDDPHDLHTALTRVGMIILPLYLYDHSGLTMNTVGFHCPWDSGQVGYVYAHPVSVRKEHGWKRISPRRREKLIKWMRGEVETYDQYLTGEVYGYIVTSPDGDDEDSCWGFYGDTKYVKREAESVADWFARDESRRKQNTLKAWIRHHVPLHIRQEQIA